MLTFVACLLLMAAAETALCLLAVILIHNAARMLKPTYRELCYFTAYHLARLVVWLARQDHKTVDFTVH